MEEEAEVAVASSEAALVVEVQLVQPQLHQDQPHNQDQQRNQHHNKAAEWDSEEVV